MNKQRVDILNRKKEQKNLSSLDERLIFDTMINYSQDTIYFKDLESRFLFINSAQAERLKLENTSLAIGKTDFDYFPQDQAQKAFEDEQRIIATATPILSNIEILKWPSGEINWVSVSKYPLHNSEGEIIGTWGVSRDITAQKNAEEELEKLNIQLKALNENLQTLSLIDPLSGLYNRRYFSEIMKKTFEDYKMKILHGIYTNFSICVSDIDLFKKVNDSFGHLAGDDIIKHVGNIIKTCIRDTDIAFRYGGDEFVILFHDVNKNDAGEIASRLSRTIMESPIISSEGEISITISMGISSVDEAIDINDLLDKADKRLYLSKKNGRNMITL
jgi:diguanylate cyclase (GGDEF)-like protein/PAS domain S-box-containing protein